MKAQRKTISVCSLAFCLALVFNAHITLGQTNTITIQGYIVDSISQGNIANANIVSLDKQHGTTSDEMGFFNITINSPTSLKVSVLGYNSKVIRFENHRDTSIVLQLLPKAYELKEVSVGSQQMTYNYALNKFTVLDYNFIDDNILVLQKQRKMRGDVSIVLLNNNFDTISFVHNLPNTSTKIYKDCLGSVHLLTKDRAYQIIIDSTGMSFYKAHDLNKFKQLLDNCLFKQDDNIFFINTTNIGFGHEIIYINETEKKAKLLLKYTDRESFSKLVDNTNDISQYYYLHTIANASTNDSATIAHIHGFNREYRYFSEIENKPVKNAIAIVNDTIVYFNYYKSKLQLFSQVDKQPIEVDITNYKAKGWSSHIIKDEMNNDLYTAIKHQAFLKIFAVDYNNGTLKFATQLSRFSCEAIKINNGYIYYLSNPSMSRYHIKRLSRIKI